MTTRTATQKGGSKGKITIAVFSDTHSNSTVAICPPDVNKDDGGKYVRSTWQVWLWQSWLEWIAEVKKAAKGGKLYVIGNGDLVEVDAKDRSNQLISTNVATSLDIAQDVCEPLTSLADRLYITRGTGAHTGKAGEYEELLAKLLGAEQDDVGRQAHWYILATVAGVLIEAAHHSAGGRKASAAAGAVARLAEETILEYAGSHDRVPDLVIRSHVHTYHDSGDNIQGCRAITTPCWTGASEYVHRLALGHKLPDIGGTIITCQDGQYEVKTTLYRPLRSHTRK